MGRYRQSGFVAAAAAPVREGCSPGGGRRGWPCSPGSAHNACRLGRMPMLVGLGVAFGGWDKDRLLWMPEDLGLAGRATWWGARLVR